MQICQVRQLGLMPYQQAWDLQNQLAAQVASGELPATLLLLEHPHTITFGRSGKAANLLWSPEVLDQRGVQVFWVDRGGDVTYHGPGQLVGYPLLQLNASNLLIPPGTDGAAIPRADYIAYLRQLEEVLILALEQFGLPAGRLKNLTGVWVNRAKIAAIGVKVDARGITRHGFALNVDPDMSYWESIIGCGLGGYTPASMADLLTNPPEMSQVRRAVISAFEAVFGLRC
ncbi:MAG: lipoyl(octanoyl) transferase LipB, partial [Acidobacteriaceae bacterium]